MNVMAPRDKTACQTFPCKCKICISSIESDVYNKKKIQMFVVNMTFISSREVKKCILHSCLRHSWNIHFFHLTRWNKSHIHSKHLNILYIFHGSVILPYILNTICWINVTPGILVSCDPIIDVKIYLCWCDLYFMVQWFCLISWIFVG